MKTVLVTGANGFVGGHLVKELAENNLRVIGIGGGHVHTQKSPYLDGYLVLDLMDSAAMRAIDWRGIDGVIHLAGLAAAGPSFDEPLRYINTNMGIETNLFEAALAQGLKPRCLIISSGMLYDPKASLPLTETSTVVPISPYAVSKIGQEQLAHYYNSRGFECIVARPFNHIGPGQNLGFIVPDLTKQVIEYKKGQTKEILVGNLDAKRDYTDVRDIARAYRLMLEHGRAGETYNVCSGTALSGHEILEGILAAAGVQAMATQDPSRMRPSDNPLIFGNHDKLTEATGWQPEIAIGTTLADVVADWNGRQ